MAGVKLTAVLAALVLSGSLATAAHAESVNSDPSKILAERNQWAPLVQHKTIEWDAAKSRFGLKLDVDQQPGAAGSETKNVQAGAYFKITPSLRIGGAVALSDRPASQSYTKVQPEDRQPRVRLETAFKF